MLFMPACLDVSNACLYAKIAVLQLSVLGVSFNLLMLQESLMGRFGINPPNNP
jgi:hypothetical protein